MSAAVARAWEHIHTIVDALTAEERRQLFGMLGACWCLDCGREQPDGGCGCTAPPPSCLDELLVELAKKPCDAKEDVAISQAVVDALLEPEE